MRNINDHNEYHKYKSTSNNTNNSGRSSGNGPTGLGWFVIGIVVYMFLFFLFNGASAEAIETLLAFGILAYLFVQWISK